MTIYKPLKSIASTAAQVAVELVQGKQPAFNAKLDNGKGQVDSILLKPTLLTRDNLDILVRTGSIRRNRSRASSRDGRRVMEQQPLFEMRGIVKEFSACARCPASAWPCVPANAWACAARTAPASPR